MRQRSSLRLLCCITYYFIGLTVQPLNYYVVARHLLPKASNHVPSEVLREEIKNALRDNIQMHPKEIHARVVKSLRSDRHYITIRQVQKLIPRTRHELMQQRIECPECFMLEVSANGEITKPSALLVDDENVFQTEFQHDDASNALYGTNNTENENKTKENHYDYSREQQNAAADMTQANVPNTTLSKSTHSLQAVQEQQVQNENATIIDHKKTQEKNVVTIIDHKKTQVTIEYKEEKSLIKKKTNEVIGNHIQTQQTEEEDNEQQKQYEKTQTRDQPTQPEEHEHQVDDKEGQEKVQAKQSETNEKKYQVEQAQDNTQQQRHSIDNQPRDQPTEPEEHEHQVEDKEGQEKVQAKQSETNEKKYQVEQAQDNTQQQRHSIDDQPRDQPTEPEEHEHQVEDKEGQEKVQAKQSETNEKKYQVEQAQDNTQQQHHKGDNQQETQQIEEEDNEQQKQYEKTQTRAYVQNQGFEKQTQIEQPQDYHQQQQHNIDNQPRDQPTEPEEHEHQVEDKEGQEKVQAKQSETNEKKYQVEQAQDNTQQQQHSIDDQPRDQPTEPEEHEHQVEDKEGQEKVQAKQSETNEKRYQVEQAQDNTQQQHHKGDNQQQAQPIEEEEHEQQAEVDKGQVRAREQNKGLVERNHIEHSKDGNQLQQQFITNEVQVDIPENNASKAYAKKQEHTYNLRTQIENEGTQDHNQQQPHLESNLEIDTELRRLQFEHEQHLAHEDIDAELLKLQKSFHNNNNQVKNLTKEAAMKQIIKDKQATIRAMIETSNKTQTNIETDTLHHEIHDSQRESAHSPVTNIPGSTVEASIITTTKMNSTIIQNSSSTHITSATVKDVDIDSTDSNDNAITSAHISTEDLNPPPPPMIPPTTSMKDSLTRMSSTQHHGDHTITSQSSTTPSSPTDPSNVEISSSSSSSSSDVSNFYGLSCSVTQLEMEPPLNMDELRNLLDHFELPLFGDKETCKINTAWYCQYQHKNNWVYDVRQQVLKARLISEGCPGIDGKTPEDIRALAVKPKVQNTRRTRKKNRRRQKRSRDPPPPTAG